jgi:3-hydroxybutyryl-CoA dehydrogenase
MHFFNPVWSIPLVEIVRGEVTAEPAITAARAVAEAIGKEAIVVRDVPGFATSRLDNIAAFEAMRMLEEGVADAADIDRAAVLAYGHPIGPLRLSDVVGLDVRLDIARHLSGVYGERYAPPAILVDLVARGDLGRKTGRGFFTWSDPPGSDTRTELTEGG